MAMAMAMAVSLGRAGAERCNAAGMTTVSASRHGAGWR
jgi:hypothetical protein